jgi:pseudaminic acid cytidylyltransferase
MNIAIIPARGGSKRIPRKNIKNFCGQPIIAYSIRAAQQSELFDRIIVSTDDEEIADVSQQYGAEIPFMRPAELADDYIGTHPVVRHCVNWLMGQREKPENICCIYATAPFLQPEYLKKGFHTLQSEHCTYAFSVTSFAFPIQRSIRIISNGGVEPIFPEHIPKRSQDLEDAYHDAGQFYWGKTESFLNNMPVFSPHSKAIILPRHLVLDIDTLEDWEKAELMFRAWRQARTDLP